MIVKKIKKFLDDNVIEIAFFVLIIGVVIIVVFSIVRPFNDWSFHLNAGLFGAYGNFIGGFVGSLFSLVAALFLYRTLVAQHESLKKQDAALNYQKETSKTERFEATFFNLLKAQQSILLDIKAYFSLLDGSFSVVPFMVQGREFFARAKKELSNIWSVIERAEFLGSFDEDSVDNLLHRIDELSDNRNSFGEDDERWRKQQIVREGELRFTIKKFGITKEYWEEMHESDVRKKVEAMYGLFFQHYHYAIGHYFRHLYHIVEYVKYKEMPHLSKEEPPFKYISFIQAQMSSFELMLLFYDSISSPRHFDLLNKCRFFDNLVIEDLIDESHNCCDIKLERRKVLLG